MSVLGDRVREVYREQSIGGGHINVNMQQCPRRKWKRSNCAEPRTLNPKPPKP